MRPLRRRTRFERMIKAARLPSGVESAVADFRPSKGVKSGVSAVVAATAASAVISAARRRLEGTRSDQ
jgi:hypothetical protein